MYLQGFRMRRSALIAAALACLGATPAVKAQQEARPLRLVVAFAAGGSTDTAARVLAPLLAEKLKRPVVVENRPGGNGVIALQTVLSAPADGSTMYLQSISVISSTFIKDFQIDVLKELEPVAKVWNFSYYLLVNGSLPVSNAREFVDYVKKSPGKLSYAAPTVSSLLAMESLKAKHGLDLVTVRYKGSAPAALAVMANEVQASFDTAGVYRQHLAGGKVRALLFTGKRRDAALPEVPTSAEAGLPETAVSLTGGLWAKAGAPAEVVGSVGTALREILQRPDVQKQFDQIGLSAEPGTAAELGRQARVELDFWHDAAKAIGYRPE